MNSEGFSFIKWEMLERSHQHFKLVIFDLDGTLTQERSIWEYIHKQLGKWYGFAEEYQKKFLAGEISYDRFCELDAEVWKGMKVEELSEIVKTVPFHPGVDELIGYLKHKGTETRNGFFRTFSPFELGPSEIWV